MRGFSAGVVLIALVASTSVETQSTQAPSPQQPQQPVFRAGIELVTVDVTALDSNGRQVTDLTTADFQVEIDGDRRQVTSAEYVRSADPLRAIGTPHKVVVPDETFSSSNAKGQPSGRLIVILVDQGNIRTGSARAVMNSAKKFVDTLTPEDRVAVIAVPGPGELVDFTTNHDRVRESLLRIVGQAGALKTRFNLSVTEVDGDLYARRRAARPRGDPARVRPVDCRVGSRAVRARSRTGRRRAGERSPAAHAGLGARHARGAEKPRAPSKDRSR